jgi:hypothetical protein
VEERQLFPYVGHHDSFTPHECSDAIALLCDHLGVEIWVTNATKHGYVETVLRKAEPDPVPVPPLPPAPPPEEETILDVQGLFRANCVHVAGNYEVTPGQAAKLAHLIARAAIAAYAKQRTAK